MNFQTKMHASMVLVFATLASLVTTEVTGEKHAELLIGVDEGHLTSPEVQEHAGIYWSVAKKGIDSCACCSSKQLFFCCNDCMRQRQAVTEMQQERQRSLEASRSLLALKDSFCACCRSTLLLSVERRCCRQCVIIQEISMLD